MIESIANAIAHTDGCSLLDVDPGLSTNRTVYTFVGTPEAVIEGAMSAARAAYQLIDMKTHQGKAELIESSSKLDSIYLLTHIPTKK